MPDLTVDFDDTDSVAAAVPKVQRLIERAESSRLRAAAEVQQAYARASEAEIELARWKTLLLTLEQLTEAAPPRSFEDPDSGSSKQKALRVLTTINGPASVGDVAKRLQEFSRKTVGWALWTLANEGAIERVGHGRYAPSGWEANRPSTDCLAGAGLSVPTPSSTQVDAIVKASLDAARRRGEGREQG